jgi:hypothetical protein
MKKLLKFFGSLVKKSLKMDSFSQIGNRPQFFNIGDKKLIKEHGLFAWAGYEATTKLCNDGFFLLVDTCTKFVQQPTMWSEIKSQLDEGYTQKEIVDYYTPVEGGLRVVIITSYNPKTY